MKIRTPSQAADEQIRLLERLLAEQQKTNELLARLVDPAR